MKRIYDVMIDLMNPRQNILCLKRGDKGASAIRFTIMNNGKPFDMSDVSVATVKGVKPDKTIIYADATIEKDAEGYNINVIDFDLPEQSSTVVGKSTYELTLQDVHLAIITTFDFYLSVEDLLYNEEDYLSEDDLAGFRAYMQATRIYSQDTKSYVDNFREVYGDEKDLLANTEELHQFYEDYISDLQIRVDRGDFNGAQGIPGERGADGVVSEAGFLIGFEISDGNLIVIYSNEDENEFSINDEGNIILTY